MPASGNSSDFLFRDTVISCSNVSGKFILHILEFVDLTLILKSSKCYVQGRNKLN